MYRDRLTENRSRELVASFLDDFLAQRGWWAARAAWVNERGMVIDTWRVSALAPAALEPLLHHSQSVDPVDPGDVRYAEPSIVPIEEVPCIRASRADFEAAGIDEFVVVDVAGAGPFDLRLIFAVDAAHRRAPDGIEALRTGAALLPTLIRQEKERTAFRRGAMREPLTGLLNRAGLEELASQPSSGSSLRAVLYLDLDGFKQVNDGHGHAAGDGVLLDTARRLAGQVRPNDLVARLGGDEFVVVAETVVDEASLVSLSQRIVGAVCRDIILESGAVVSVSASAGVALWTEDEHLDAVMASADALMYEAKRIGGGIAMRDATGRILVRDPFAGSAAPEEVERGRAAVRVLRVDPLDESEGGAVLVVVRAELCAVPADETATGIIAAVERMLSSNPENLIIEPRGRGWARDGILGDLVRALHERLPTTAVTVLIDAQPGALELRLAADELRAAGLVAIALGGIGSAHGGDLLLVAQVAPNLISLDREAVINLTRTQSAGLVARLAAAVGSAVGAQLMVVEPPGELSDDTLRKWGVSTVARPLERV